MDNEKPAQGTFPLDALWDRAKRDSGAIKGLGATTAHEGKNTTVKEMIRHEGKCLIFFYNLELEILLKWTGGGDDVVEATLVLQIQRQHPQAGGGCIEIVKPYLCRTHTQNYIGTTQKILYFQHKVCITVYLYIDSPNVFYLIQVTPPALGVQEHHNTLFISHTDFPCCLEAICKLGARVDAKNKMLSFRYTPQQQTTVGFRNKTGSIQTTPR